MSPRGAGERRRPRLPPHRPRPGGGTGSRAGRGRLPRGSPGAAPLPPLPRSRGPEKAPLLAPGTRGAAAPASPPLLCAAVAARGPAAPARRPRTPGGGGRAPPGDGGGKGEGEKRSRRSAPRGDPRSVESPPVPAACAGPAPAASCSTGPSASGGGGGNGRGRPCALPAPRAARSRTAPPARPCAAARPPANQRGRARGLPGRAAIKTAMLFTPRGLGSGRVGVWWFWV